MAFNFFNKNSKINPESKNKKDSISLKSQEPSCNIYLSKKNNEIVICANFGAGLTIEQSNCIILVFSIDSVLIGEKVKKALSEFIIRDIKEFNLRNNTSWPGFEISKAKSKRFFGENYTFISVRKTKSAFEIKSFHYFNQDERFHIECPVEADDKLLGEKIIEAYNKCEEFYK
jgi:hypothetical protein